MAQYVKQANIFGRIGSGIGKGLGEQIPKEVERNRLATGLKELGEQKGLSPFQQFAGLVGVAHEHPQVVQSGERILNQQNYLNALKNQYEGQGQQQGKKGYVPNQEEINKPIRGELSTLATPEDTAESYKSFIPPTEQEERRDAYENFQKNPARYNYDFNEALNERKSVTQRNQEIQKAHQTQEATAVGKEEKVKTGLKAEVDKLGLGNVPPKAYQKFEEKVLNSVRSKKDGGEGLTQEQAIKKHSISLDDANRNYLDLGALSAWSPRAFNAQVNSLQKEFASRGDLPLMMDQLIADYNISPAYAAHRTYPIKNGEIKTLNNLGIKVGGPSIGGVSLAPVNDSVYEKLKNEMGKTHSPLSIEFELQEKGYDPIGWRRYLNNHRDNLEGWQIDQLNKGTSVLNLTDKWLHAWE
jgi:hypothetical protein